MTREESLFVLRWVAVLMPIVVALSLLLGDYVWVPC